MSRPQTSSLASVLAAVIASGCGPSLTVDHWQAPEVNIGGARRAVVTDAYGRNDSVTAINRLMVDQLSLGGWFEAIDATRHERLESDGREAWLRRSVMSPGTLYLRADVLEDNAIINVTDRDVILDDGSLAIVRDEFIVARTLLSLTVADIDGIIIDELEIEGIHETEGDGSRFTVDQALQRSARAAVVEALRPLQPRLARVSVPLDESDAEVWAIVNAAKDGSFIIRKDAADALANNTRTAAIYNRAALLESVGLLQEAVPLYVEAARKSDAPSFAARVAQEASIRLEDARLLGL